LTTVHGPIDPPLEMLQPQELPESRHTFGVLKFPSSTMLPWAMAWALTVTVGLPPSITAPTITGVVLVTATATSSALPSQGVVTETVAPSSSAVA
jgi:hypothetical protein